MKSIFSVKTIFVLVFVFLYSSCDELSLKTIILDNQSDFEVSVDLYTGTNNEDGSMFFETYTVAAASRVSVKSETNTVYVDGYTPADDVTMDIREPERKIVFTNKS